MFEEITGRPQVKEHLTGYVRCSPYRPILFHGNKGVGKHYIAKLLSKYLNCEGEKISKCLCNSCKANIEVSIRKPTKNSWGVEDIRVLLDEVKGFPIGQEHRVIIIENIHDMSLEAADCFPKSIEEAPSFNIFVFLSDSINDVIPTIRSRCQSLYIPPISKDCMNVENYHETFGLPKIGYEKDFSYKERGLTLLEVVFNPDTSVNLYPYKDLDIHQAIHDAIAVLDLYFCNRSEMIKKRMNPIEVKWGKANIIALSERLVGYLQLISSYENISKWHHLFQVVMSFKLSMKKVEND
jgi:hypothetical protein